MIRCVVLSMEYGNRMMLVFINDEECGMDIMGFYVVWVCNE
jgi:hypothetical protein